MKPKCMNQETLNTALLIVFVLTTQVLAQLPADNFNDNKISDMWEIIGENSNTFWVEETNQRLEVRAWSNADGDVQLMSNGWALDVAADFSIKVDFHYSRISRDDAGISIGISPGEGNLDNRMYVSAGCDEDWPYYYFEVVSSGNTVDEGDVARNSNSGTLYLSYNSAADELYLSASGYGPAHALQTVRGLLQGTWSTSSVRAGMGVWSNGVSLASGQAYLDDFVVNSGTIVGPNAGADAAVLFADDFSDGAADGWTEVHGRWSAASRTYVGQEGGFDDALLSLAGNASWKNYTVEARVRPDFTDGFNDFGLVFYAQNANEFLRFTVGGDDPQTPRITHNLNSESVGELATVVARPRFVNNRWYALKLELCEDQVSAYVDGQLVAYADNLPFLRGSVGVTADDPEVSFDDVVVTETPCVPSPDAGTLDISSIMIMTECEFLDGALNGNTPWDFEIEVVVSDPGDLHHIDVLKPGSTTSSLTMLEEDLNSWATDLDKYASLSALRRDYPEGTYTMAFYDSANKLLKTIALDYSNLSIPASNVDFTYPAVNGQREISTNPTFTWTVSPSAGDLLFPGVDNETTGESAYGGRAVPMTTQSWNPGPLSPNHEYQLDVTISRVQDWVGPGLPTQTVGGDEFEYFLTVDYINSISFITSASSVPTPGQGSAQVQMPDINWINITSAKNHQDGIPVGARPWFFEIWIHFDDLGTVHHTEITKPGDVAPFARINGDGDYDPPNRYASLTDLRVDYPLGTYTFELRDADNALLTTVDLDYSGLPGEPANPVDFTYPATDGQTGVNTSPTLTWTAGEGHTQLMGLEDITADQDVGGRAPVAINDTSWAPGPLQDSHEYNLEVSVCQVKDWVGPDWPTMSVGTDQFSYSLMTEYINGISFTASASSARPSTVWYVGPPDANALGGPAGTQGNPYPTLQEAINQAQDGDTIFVLPGTYSGAGNHSVDTLGKQLILQSLEGPGNCIIDCQGAGRGFYIHSGEGPDTMIDGFTIAGGAAERGSALFCAGSTPTIANCRIVGNSPNTVWTGDDLYVSGIVEIGSGRLEGSGMIQLSQGARLKLDNCTITCNVTNADGMGSDGAVAVPAGSDVIMGGQAVTTFARLRVGGRLHIGETARFLFADIRVDEAGALTVGQSASITNSHISCASVSCLNIDSANFNGNIAGNTLELSINAAQSGRALEVRGLDQQGGGEPAAIGLDSIPSQTQANWSLQRLELAADTELKLVSTLDDQAPFDQGRELEALYVRELVLGDGAILDVGALRLYYDQDNLVLGQDAEILVSQVIPGRSLDLLDFDDPNEFVNRVDTSRPEAVELIIDDPLDPAGLMVVHSTTDPILVKGRFDPTRATRLLVKFDYAAGPDVRIAVYVSESPVLGSLDRIAVDSFIGTGTQTLHVFESWADVSGLDLSRGCWVELELWLAQGLNPLQLLNQEPRLYGLGADADVLINDWLVEEHCDDAICRDVTLDQAVRWEDLLVAKAAMGRYADLGGADAVSRCFEGAFCADGYVDTYDQFSLDWTVGHADTLCGPLELTGDSIGLLQDRYAPRRLSGLVNLNPPPGLMLLGKGNLSYSDADFKDHLFHLDTSQSENLPYDFANVRVVSAPSQEAYIVSTEKGLIKPSGESLLAPMRKSITGGTARFGIDLQGPYPVGLPLLDACITSDSLYVAPVVVNPDGGVTYVAAARLSSDGSVVEQIYHDAQWFNPERFNKPERYYGLREIELDEQGNLYALSVYRLPGCTMLWQFDSQGTILAKSSGEELGIEDPLALCYCPVDRQLYVASGLLTAEAHGQSTIYQLVAEGGGFRVAREIVVPDMQHITSMTADAEGVLWVTGFSLAEAIPAKVYAHTGIDYSPRLARIDLSRDGVESNDITGAVGEIGFPTSIVRVKE